MELIKILESFSKLEISELDYKDKDIILSLKKDCINNTNFTSKKVDIKEIKEELEEEERYKIKSPMVGIFYSKSSPEEDNFVKLGDEVKKGDVVCIIEAMKVFNEIKSPINGIIRKINFQDEDFVEYNQVLFEVDEK
ncbi:MAG: acetyl-CoA carboxylase biotin carboxyl carrier protein [Peptoniphilaceae bacterium]